MTTRIFRHANVGFLLSGACFCNDFTGPVSEGQCAEEAEDAEVDIEQCSDSESKCRPTRSKHNQTSSSDDERFSPEPTPAVPIIVGSCNCEDLNVVQCHLETKELWDKFHELGTEMIITKTGRRMFPTLRVSFSGPLRLIQPPDRYAVILDIVPIDSRRYRYAYHRSSWLVAGKADPQPTPRLYAHPDSPIATENLRRQMISFEKIKLTNNEMDKNGQIVLNSMHRYQPRIILVRLNVTQNVPTSPKDLQGLDHRTYVFPETVFTAVTAYQNQLITKLKIDSNPFAKGFRDSSRLTDYDRDPTDGFLDQHLRSPIRMFPDPMMQIMQHDPELLEKARQHLQMWGRAPELLLPQLYQRPNLSAFNLNLWSQWPRPPMNGFQRTSPTTLTPLQTSDSSILGPLSPEISKGKDRFSPYPVPSSRHFQQPQQKKPCSEASDH